MGGSFASHRNIPLRKAAIEAVYLVTDLNDVVHEFHIAKNAIGEQLMSKVSVINYI